EVSFTGKNLFGYREPENTLDAQNSGTTARLLLGLLSGQSFFSVINGDSSLQTRPMKRVVDPLRKMGARIEGRNDAYHLPLAIKGQSLKRIKFKLPLPSAQLKSAVILAGLLSEGETEINEPVPSRDHTERMLDYLGAEIKKDKKVIRVQGKNKFKAKKIIVSGDFSSACFFVAAALLAEDSEIIIPDIGINPTRIGFLKAAERMGGNIKVHEKKERCNEPLATLSVSSSDLKGIKIKPEEIPVLIDEIPLIALLATQANGVTEVHGASELRVKESDRIRAIVVNFRRMGVDLEEKEDGFIIEGPQRLKGASVESFGDHRIAMTMAIAGLVADGETEIKDFDCFGISFPDFYSLLGRWQKDG
ncbi:hypothetical protein LCGC14_1515860, partial [marine sediment metagenome]